MREKEREREREREREVDFFVSISKSASPPLPPPSPGFFFGIFFSLFFNFFSPFTTDPVHNTHLISQNIFLLENTGLFSNHYEVKVTPTLLFLCTCLFLLYKPPVTIFDSCDLKVMVTVTMQGNRRFRVNDS